MADREEGRSLRVYCMVWHAKEKKRWQSQVESLEAGSWLPEPFACPASTGAIVRISNSGTKFQVQILMLN